ncbi:MAG: hypothetical protein OEX02_10515 [Cyclobacteriaceae bacterium]|nr:hypothetical protein [Cyclobacteriaceae bacterium]
MDKLITILVFQYPHEAYVIKSRLETEGIYVLLKDELTIQNYNFISNAVGGIKLQVKESDRNAVLRIIKEAGLNVEKEQVIPRYLLWLEKRRTAVLWILYVLGFLSLLLLVVFVITAMPDKKERLAMKEKEERMLKAEMLEYDYLPKIDSLLNRDPQEGIRYSQLLLEENYPENTELLDRVAYGYSLIDSFRQASDYYLKSLEHQPSVSSEHLAAIAYCEVQLQNFDLAIFHLLKAVSMSNYYKYDLAEVYELKGDIKNAFMYYTGYIQYIEGKYDDSAHDVEFQKLKLKVMDMGFKINK